MILSTVKYGLILSLLFQSCISHKPVDPLAHKGRSVILGHGGGFAGDEEEYRLLDNGQLYHRALLNEPFKLTKAKTKKRAEKWITTFDSLSTLHSSFNNPGNTYKFVVFKKDTIENRVVWSKMNEQPDEKITTFYQQFLEYWVYEKPKK